MREPEKGLVPDSIEGAITRPAGLSDGGDGAVISPLVASGTEGTVDVAGTLQHRHLCSGLGTCSCRLSIGLVFLRLPFLVPVYGTTVLHPLLNPLHLVGLAWAEHQAGVMGSQDTGRDLDIDRVCGTGKNLDVVIMWDPDVGPEMKLGH